MHIPARHVGTTKLLLIALDGFCGTIEAQYNPHEIQVDKTVPWQAEDSKATCSPLEPIGMGPRTIALELFLDCFERGANASLAGRLAILTQMTLAIDPDSRYEDLRRPPLLALVNGPVPSSGAFWNRWRSRSRCSAGETIRCARRARSSFARSRSVATACCGQGDRPRSRRRRIASRATSETA
jgi:hypothetical protein